MTMARQAEGLKQTINSNESGDPYPTKPTTDKIIILGENFTPEPAVHVSTGSVAENYIAKIENDFESVDFRPTNTPELQEAAGSDIYAFDGWLDFKVKAELLYQVFDKENPFVAVDLDGVKSILAAELAAEKRNRLSNAAHLYHVKSEASENYDASDNCDDFNVKDVKNIQKRIDVDREVIAYINALESEGDQSLTSIALERVEKMKPKVAEEIASILLAERQEWDQLSSQKDGRIAQLQEAVVNLEIKVAQVEAERDERDLQLFDYELVAHLEDEAKDIAR